MLIYYCIQRWGSDMIERLPRDVFYQVILGLDIRELHRLKRVSQFFLRMIDDKFWKMYLPRVAQSFMAEYPELSRKNALLLAAVYCGLTEYAIKYIRRRADIHVKLYYKQSQRKDYFIQPIHYAAFCGNPSTVQALIKRHAIFKAPKKVEFYTSPLHYAVAQGNVSCCRLLLDKGANINQLSDWQHYGYDKTPIHIAAIFNQVECYVLLRDRGADIHYRSSRESEQAIHYAIQNQSLEVLQMLLKDGADPNTYINEDPISALALACDTKNPQIVLALLRHGANTRRDMSLFFHRSPLHYTLCRKQYHLARVILDFDRTLVDFQLPMWNGDLQQHDWDDSALHLVAERGDLEGLQLLMTYGADPHLLTSGDTAFTIAQINGHTECADILAEYAIEYNFNKYSFTFG